MGESGVMGDTGDEPLSLSDDDEGIAIRNGESHPRLGGPKAAIVGEYAVLSSSSVSEW